MSQIAILLIVLIAYFVMPNVPHGIPMLATLGAVAILSVTVILPVLFYKRGQQPAFEQRPQRREKWKI